MIKLNIGDSAPNFERLDSKGTVHRLGDYIGKKLLIYFYPKDNTPGCTNQACSLKESYDDLKAAGFQILGVSMDDEKSHERFILKYDLPFPLLIDSDKKMIESFGVWGPKKFMGKEYDGIHRTTFTINEQGKIVHVITKPNTKNHGEEILNLEF